MYLLCNEIASGVDNDLQQSNDILPMIPFPSGLSPVALSFCESYIVIFLSQAAPDLFRLAVPDLLNQAAPDYCLGWQ